MGLKIIRICDLCGEEYEQIIDEELKESENYPIGFTCSDCILEIHHLCLIQSEANDGRGISCVQQIISCLRKRDMTTAKYIYQYEGDKIRAYPKIQEWMGNYFGCRLHLEKNCQDSLCKKMRGYNKEKLSRIPGK